MSTEKSNGGPFVTFREECEILRARVVELEAQLASKDQLIAEQNNLAKERQEWALHTNEVIMELKVQLAETEALEISHGERIEKLTKLLLLAKDALEQAYPLYNGHAFKSAATEAIAAINNSKMVEGLILCDAEHVAWNFELEHAAFNRLLALGFDNDTKLYAPRRSEK